MNLSRRVFGTAAVSFLFTALFLAGCSPQQSASNPAGDTAAPGTDKAKSGGAAPKELVFGFVPSAEADKIAEDAKPMAAFVEKEVGIPVKTFTSTNYVGLIEAMGSGKVDIGSLPPLAYVLAKDQKAAEVMLKTSRKKSLTYKSMFVVRADSGIKRLEDAKGKRIAFVDPSSASGYLFPAAYMKAKGIEPESFFSQQMYAGAHDKAVMSVYNGDVDIATVYDDARNKLEKLPAYKDVKQKVVKIAETDPIPNDTISVRTGLDPALVAKIKAALLKYAHSPEGQKTLYEVYEVDDLADAKDSDYDPVRQVAKTMDVQLSSFGDKKAAPAPASPKP